MKKIMLSKLTVPFLLAITIFFIPPAAYGQSTIHGKVWKSIDEPAINASVLLLRTNDSSLVKAIICNKDGNYVFKQAQPGSYIVSISMVGYLSAYSSIIPVREANLSFSVDAITMVAEASTLNQVTVVAIKPLLEQKIGRLVINVAASITSAGNTALEVLERAPGVTVDHQNNTLSMNGKNGVVLMINGKISHIPVSALMQLLESMPAGTIERIELITTPPASLDAQGNAGYINIVLKENNTFGTNGSVSATAGYGRGWVTTANMNINHRKGRLNLYGDISYSRSKKPLFVNDNNIFSNSGTITEMTTEVQRVHINPNISARAGIDVEWTKRTVMGLLISGYDNRYTQSEHNTTTILKNRSPDTLIKHNNVEKSHWYNYAANINLQHSFINNGKLLFNLDYIHYHNNQPVSYHSAYFNKNNAYLYDLFFRTSKRTPIRFWVGSVDYSKKLTEHMSMETGIKQTLSSFDNDLGFQTLQQMEWRKDDALSAVYRLKEDYTAAYASFNITLSKTTEAKAG
ncbi:MAG: outer membrane beta-barrel protein, partial [Chitinophagaceae bacterium]